MFTGIKLVTGDATLQQLFSDGEPGIEVVRVVENSPAAAAVASVPASSSRTRT